MVSDLVSFLHSPRFVRPDILTSRSNRLEGSGYIAVLGSGFSCEEFSSCSEISVYYFDQKMPPKKLKIDPVAIQKRVSESIAKTKSLEEKIAEVSAFRFTPPTSRLTNSRTSFEAYLVCRFGLSKVSEALKVVKCHLPNVVKEKELSKCLGAPEEEGSVLLGLFGGREVSRLDSTRTATIQLLTPPSATCYSCERQLVVNHPPTTVRIYTVEGLAYGEKWSLRCNGCQHTYSYSKYGSPSDHWSLYPDERELIEASDTCFVERKVFQWMTSLR